MEASLLRRNTGGMCLGKGWKEFAMSNGLKSGESFTLEAILENGTPMLGLFSTQSRSDRSQQGEYSKHSEKESIFVEHSSGKETRKAIINRDVRRDSYPASRNPFVTLRLTYDNLRNSRRVSSSINPLIQRNLPLSFTRENGLDEPGIITLVGNDGTKLEANLLRENTGIMCLGKGWKEFAMSNGLRSGELFTLEAILENGIPMLSLVSTQSTRYRSQEGECAKDSEKESISTVPSKGNKKRKATSKREEKRDSSSASQNRFVTFTPEDIRDCILYLPQDLTALIGLERKCREIVVTDERERSWALELKFNKSSDTFYISRGWRSFCDENDKKAGGVFVFRLVGNRETPVLSFCSTESIKNNKENCMELERKKKHLKCIDSTSPSQNRFVTLSLSHDNLRTGTRHLPLSFARDNGLDKPGIITLVDKDGTKRKANLRREKTGKMFLGKGWKDFVIANGLKSSKSFTLEAVLENGTHMLSLVSIQSTSDRSQQGECSKDSKKELISAVPSRGNKTRKAMNNRDVRRDSFPASQNQFVTLSLSHDSLRKGRQYLPLSFTRENGLDEPGIITLVSKDGTKLEASLLRENKGIMCLGKGWKEFAIENGLKTGELFTLEAILEKGTPMLSLLSTESTSDRSQQGECSKDSEKESISAEPSKENKKKKATSNREERRDSSSAIQNRYVTLTLTPEDVSACKLILPSQFMKANGINKLGKITLVGQNRTKWFAYLLSKNGIVALGSGWKGFCEANGVKTGESFTLEYIDEQDTTPVFKFWSNSVE
ncbi:predicted protein [Arabidopsis lyrata subsp. lyrata]|uniref:Predicted protein n=1 Tax=Arabidopsis lyrata subsp. lyrata TaxID=81972 RepID=D7LIB4_ARALL|nr:predicted protein [Arabidopsis lyrata subsp. lyrata]